MTSRLPDKVPVLSTDGVIDVPPDAAERLAKAEEAAARYAEQTAELRWRLNEAERRNDRLQEAKDRAEGVVVELLHQLDALRHPKAAAS